MERTKQEKDLLHVFDEETKEKRKYPTGLTEMQELDGITPIPRDAPSSRIALKFARS